MRRLLLIPLLLLASCQQPSASTPAIEATAINTSKLLHTPAPAFTLPDQDNRPVSLSSFKGRWLVLYFFPHEDTPGCACAANSFTTLLYNLSDIPADVLTITDQLPDDAKYYRDKYDIQSTMLSDIASAAMIPYGARPTDHDPIIRCTFLIDPTGKIAWHWPEVVSQGHVDRIKAKLKELKGE